MKYTEMRENRRHGTADFPIGYYSERHAGYYSMPYHWHGEYEIIYIYGGGIDLSIDGKVHALKKGDTVFINGGSLHGGVSAGCGFECIVFDLETLLAGAKACMREFQSVADSAGQSCIVFGENSEVTYTARSLFGALKEKPAGYRFLCAGNLIKLLGCILKYGYSATVRGLTPAYLKNLRKVKYVIRYISEHYGEPLTLADLAQQGGMNAGYFCRVFNELVGMTPVEYLNSYRVNAACEKLEKGESSVTEIAFECGFNDLSYFIKVFKKFKGITPLRFERNL